MALLDELYGAPSSGLAADLYGTPKQAEKPKYMSYGDMLGQAASNIPSSAGALATNVLEAISDPLGTIRNVGNLIVGGTSKLLGEPLYPSQAGKELRSKGENAVNQMGGALKERYGGIENIKNTIATDPVGAMADISTLLSGGGAIAGRIPMAGKVASTLTTAGEVTNPINAMISAPTKAYEMAGALTKQGLGLKTGVGTEPITQAVKAGREGNQTFVENMRGTTPITQVLDDAKTNLAKMNMDKQTEYRSGMVNIKNDKTQLDFKGIDQAIADAESKGSYKGVVVNQGTMDVLKDIKDKVDTWKKQDAAEFHTPEGMDKLKQSIWESIEKLPTGSTTAYSAAKDVYNSVKKEISNQAPEYSKVMKNYTEASEQIKEIERALSLGKTASADTAMRKLQSLMRNNVNTNYGQRLELAKQLETMGGNEIMPALAGQALNQLTPRGLQRGASPATAYLAYGAGGPIGAAVDLAASSPRLVGEASYKYGQMANALSNAAQPIKNLTGKVPMTAQQAKLAALLAAQSTPRIELNNMLPNRP